MASSIRIRAVARGDSVEVQALIQHPMDTGLAKDGKGKLIPPHYIEIVTCEHAGRPVLTAYWGPAISKDPYFRFRFKGGKKGDPLKISWIDNQGKRDSLDAKIL